MAGRLLLGSASRVPPTHPTPQPLPAPQVCLQRNLPAAAELGTAAERAYEGVQMVNGLECKLCNLQQKVKKVRWAARLRGTRPRGPAQRCIRLIRGMAGAAVLPAPTAGRWQSSNAAKHAARLLCSTPLRTLYSLGHSICRGKPGPPPPPLPPTWQIAYVLGTEDFFHRRRPSKANRDEAARRQKFAAVQAAWLDKQSAAPVVAAA